MSTTTTTTIALSEPIAGLPPERDEGTFIGFDNDHNPYILKWHHIGCWYGTGNDPQVFEHPRPGFLPLHFLCREEMVDFIVSHVRIMLVAGVVKHEPSMPEEYRTKPWSTEHTYFDAEKE